MFQFGFLELWVTLIILGTFFRGPNWNFFGPFEYWDPHKVMALNNVDLSQYFWIGRLDKALPQGSAGSRCGRGVGLHRLARMRRASSLVLLFHRCCRR